ncbi:sensor histidine kinase [Shimazuella alba]|uniref:histidine kinase n=1 Tax=Shimazuella alba TaxID=2690964 RepID=A0A6I4VPL3_9BACL|nr:HAMP domain-containing sensor histidine kinase [Shimazuella alba]MXQ53509.1 HAMP domain-containing protein [Shimazuella alba]
MRHKLFGIFGKVFFYTLLILLLVISVMIGFFAEQFKSVVESTQREQIMGVFQTLINQAKGKNNNEIVQIAKEFHKKNASFEFCIISLDGKVLYKTEHFAIQEVKKNIPKANNVIVKEELSKKDRFNFTTSNEKIQFMTILSGDIRLLVSGPIFHTSIYQTFIKKTSIAFIFILIASIIASLLFAQRIAKPIQKIAEDAKRMSNLEDVPPPPSEGKDEIGALANDVYKMHKDLKMTIHKMGIEIDSRKEMEENQRYFFSAASHELKTPIAATSALLEGMLESVIEPEEYPETLRECLKMMAEQNKTVSEILEIVTLSNSAILQKKKRINLKTFITKNLTAYLTIAESKNQTVAIDVPERLNCELDPKLFGKVFSNVVLNAIQNTPEGGQIHIYTLENESFICLCVLNKNVRIPEEILPKLFEPFYRLDESRNRELGRSGLGLTIVKKTLDFMELSYALENTEQGVLFWVNLRKRTN